MHVVGHQHVGMDRNRFRRGQLREFGQKVTVVLVGEEDCRPVDAAQYRVHRISGGDNSGSSRHERVPVQSLKRQGSRKWEKMWSVPVSPVAAAGYPSMAPQHHQAAGIMWSEWLNGREK